MAQAKAKSISRSVSDTRINTFLAQVYLLMALGLAVTGFVASWTSNNIATLLKTTTPGFAFGIWR